MILNVWRMGLRYVCMRWDRLGTRFLRFGRLFIIVNERFTFVSHSIMFLFYFLLVGRIPFWRFFCFVFFLLVFLVFLVRIFASLVGNGDTTSDGYFFFRDAPIITSCCKFQILYYKVACTMCRYFLFFLYKIFYFLFFPINDFPPLSTLILYLCLWFHSLPSCVYIGR